MVIAAGLNRHRGGHGQLPGQGAQDRTRKRAAQSRVDPAANSRIFGTLSEDELINLEEVSRAIVKNGNHILLVVLSSATVWQQVQAFTRGVRMRCLPRNTPVVVLSSVQPEREVYNELCKAYDSVGVIVVGKPNKSSDMQRAGMHNASTIILLAGRPSIDDWRMVDGNGLITLQTIESQTTANIVLELLNEESAQLLTRLPHTPDDFRASRTDGKKAAVGVLGAAKQAAVKEAQQGLTAVNKMMYTDEEELLQERQQDEAFAFLPRFAGGNLFCASCLGALCAVANYVPGVIELTEALVSGVDTGQASFPWQIRVPQAFVGKTYLELATTLLRGFPSAGRIELSAVALGIYRERDRGASNDAAHVITNPPKDFRLRSADLIFVLGSSEFAEACFRDSILSGVFEHDDPIVPRDANLDAANADENRDWDLAPDSTGKPALAVVSTVHPVAADSSRNWMPSFCAPEDKTNDRTSEQII